jgi:hypothetical protein
MTGDDARSAIAQASVPVFRFIRAISQISVRRFQERRAQHNNLSGLSFQRAKMRDVSADYPSVSARDVTPDEAFGHTLVILLRNG